MIQIDMPMPENCCGCYFARGDYIEGVITLFCMTPIGRKMYAPDLISRKSRPEWCPLKEQEAVVRCKDCVHWDEAIQACDEIDGIFLPDWFCADGKRKEEGERE